MWKASNIYSIYTSLFYHQSTQQQTWNIPVVIDLVSFWSHDDLKTHQHCIKRKSLTVIVTKRRKLINSHICQVIFAIVITVHFPASSEDYFLFFPSNLILDGFRNGSGFAFVIVITFACLSTSPEQLLQRLCL